MNKYSVGIYNVLPQLALGLLLIAGHAQAQEETEQLTINSATLNSEGEKLGAGSEKDNLANIFKLQKQLVEDLLRQAGIDPDQLPPAVKAAIKKPQTQNLKAFLAFSEGLDFLDQGQFDKAEAKFAEAVRLDPDFTLAQAFYEAVPRIQMSPGEIADAEMKKALTQDYVVGILATPQDEITEDISETNAAQEFRSCYGSRSIRSLGKRCNPGHLVGGHIQPDDVHKVSDQQPDEKDVTTRSSPACANGGACGVYSTFLASSERDSNEGSSPTVAGDPYITETAVALGAGDPLTIAQKNQPDGFLRAEIDLATGTARLTGFAEGASGDKNETINVPLNRVVVNDFTDLELGFYGNDAFNPQFNGSFPNDSGTRDYDFHQGAMYFAEGIATPQSSLDTLKQDNIRVSYNGPVGADFSVGGQQASCLSCGSFSGTLDYGAGQVDNFRLRVDTRGQEQPVTAAARINADNVGLARDGSFLFDQSQGSFAVGTSSKNLNAAEAGTVSGRTFGRNAESVGGVFSIQGNAGRGATPVYGSGYFGGSERRRGND
jgi:hypothetical protein